MVGRGIEDAYQCIWNHFGGGDENILELDSGANEHLCDLKKKNLFVYLERVNFMVYELYLNLNKLYDRKKKRRRGYLVTSGSELSQLHSFYTRQLWEKT